jgi:hypothetical protein
MAQMLRRVIFVPIYPELTDAAVARMADIILQHEKTV